MVNESVTIIVVPRDRFSSVLECTQSILEHTNTPFRLVFLDLGYPGATRMRLEELCRGRPCEIVPVGRKIPITAFAEYLPRLATPYVAWVDNDTFATPGWLSALLERAREGARVLLPVTLEREGLDVDRRRLPLRNHISHAELRRVNVAGVSYVFDHKPYRRVAPEELPRDPHTVDFFELHAFFMETAVARQLDWPPMVVREHIDLGMQLHRLGIPIWCEPRSRVIFDNIHERPTFADLRFFFYRWRQRFVDDSHALFEKRWGYRFYNEQFLSNWAFRRKVFSACRYAGLPHRAADFASRAFNKLLRPKVPGHLRPDPMPASERVLEPLPASLAGVESS
jgi:hypothetical protein